MDRTAKCFADQVNKRPDLAAASGLGRTYQLVSRRIVPGQGGFSSAEICHLGAFRLDPTFPGPMREIGARRFAEGHYAQAIRCLELSIANSPDADTHFLLGQVYATPGDVRSAIASYIESNRLDPRYLPAAYEFQCVSILKHRRVLFTRAMYVRWCSDCKILIFAST